MDHTEAPDVRQAQSFLATHLVGAHGAVLGGSSASGTSTPTSDLDLVVIGPASMFVDGRTSLAATYEHHGRLVEVFAYTPAAFREWAERDVAQHRPVLPTMLAHGLVVRDHPSVTELRQWSAGRLAQGPRVPTAALDLRRYLVSALLDDLADATDAAERAWLLAATFEALAELMLLAHGRWLGTGKWLVRALRSWDAEVARGLCDALAAGDAPGLVRTADVLLARLGGRLQAGMVR